MNKILKLVFRWFLVLLSIVAPLPSFPLQYYQVNTIQEYVLPQPKEGAGDPYIVYWSRTIAPAETRAADSASGFCRAECEDADIAPGACIDLWLIEEPGRWSRLAESTVDIDMEDGVLHLTAPFPLSGRTLVIFKAIAGSLDPMSFDARAYFADWPPPLV